MAGASRGTESTSAELPTAHYAACEVAMLLRLSLLAVVFQCCCGAIAPRETPEEKAFKDKAAEFAKQGRALVAIMKSDATSFNDYTRNLDQLTDSYARVPKAPAKFKETADEVAAALNR